jgi:hypothetical protein
LDEVFGFVLDFVSTGLDAVEILDGAAVHPLRLGLVAEHEGPDARVATPASEAFGGGEHAGFEAGAAHLLWAMAMRSMAASS